MTSEPNLVQPESAGELASAETKMTSEPNLVQHESAGELASKKKKLTSEPNPVQPESAGELASAETKMTSEPNLARSKRVVEPCKKEENGRENVPPTNGVYVKLGSGHRLVVGRRVDWISWMRGRRGLRFSRRKHVRQRTIHTRSQTGSLLRYRHQHCSRPSTKC